MSKNFWQARAQITDALVSHRNDLEYHKRALEAFRREFEALDESTPTEVGNILHANITRETARVNSLMWTIQNLERLLKEYPLTPASY